MTFTFASNLFSFVIETVLYLNNYLKINYLPGPSFTDPTEIFVLRKKDEFSFVGSSYFE